MVGRSEASMSPLVQHSCVAGWQPVRSDMREGTQIGEGQYASSKATPRAASRSRWGVRTTPSP
jgi:hypothetical protein